MAGRLKCVGKRYGKNNEIIAYDMMNEAGAVQTFERNIIKDAMLKGTIEVINLQIASDGRLVDKAISLEKGETDIQKKLNHIYEAGYRGLLNGEQAEFLKLLYNGEYTVGYSEAMGKVAEKELKDKELEDKLFKDMFKLASGFENYIRQKYNCIPLKLMIKLSKGVCAQHIIYGLNSIHFDTTKEHELDLDNNSGKTFPEIYCNERNYQVSGGSLNPSHPSPITISGIRKGNDKKVYIEGNIDKLNPNAIYLIREHKVGTNNNNFAGIRLVRGLNDKNIVLVNKKENIDEPLDKVVLQAYEASYRDLMRGGNIGFIKKGNESTFYDSMDKIFKKAKLDKKLDALKIAQGFENYIREKYNCMPLKLSVKLNKGDCRQYIVYSLKQAYVSVSNFYFSEGEHNPEIYLDERNYTIQGGSLNPALPRPINKTGINNEKEENIVRIKGNKSEFSNDALYMIMERGSTTDKKLNNVFLAIGVSIGIPKGNNKERYVISNENTPSKSNRTTTGKQGWLKALGIIGFLLNPSRKILRSFGIYLKR